MAAKKGLAEPLMVEEKQGMWGHVKITTETQRHSIVHDKVHKIFKDHANDGNVSDDMETMHALAGHPGDDEITGCGYTWRRKLAHVLHNHCLEKSMLFLLFLDVLIVFAELLLLEKIFKEEKAEVEACEAGETTKEVTPTPGHLDPPANEVVEPSPHAHLRRVLSVGIRYMMNAAAEPAAHGVVGEHGKEAEALEHVEHTLHMVGLTIIGLFMMEIFLHMVALGSSFIYIKSLKSKNEDDDHAASHGHGIGGSGSSQVKYHIRWMSLLDLVVVPTSFFLEVFVPAVGSMLAILRMWRIVRVGHGIFMAQSKKNEEKNLVKEKVGFLACIPAADLFLPLVCFPFILLFFSSSSFFLSFFFACVCVAWRRN